jgi:hypothetical protein
MELVRTAPVSPLTVAKNRYDEASRVTDAFRIQVAARKRRAYSLGGQPGEVEAWARVQEAEAQWAAAEALEVQAQQDAAWQEHQANQRRMAQGYQRRAR